MITIEAIQSLNHVLAVGTIAGILAGIFLLVDMHYARYAQPLIEKFGTIAIFCITLLATLLTLVYSEVFGVIPCGFCWLERVFLYPQVLLSATSLYIRDRIMPVYGMVLSAIGLFLSLYHHYIQMGGSQFVKCPVAGTGADCAKRFIFEFGFVTFPLMATVLFALLIVLYVYIIRARPFTIRLTE